jgi:hypothetical protein
MLLAQAGYGRGNKIHTALDEDLVGGVILSPKDERRERLEECVSDLRNHHDDAWILVDPQFYVTTVSVPRDGRLPEYDYYADHAPLSRTQFSPRQIAGYVRACLDYQNALSGLTYILSPSVLFDDFRDSWSQISLNMAEASIDHHAGLTDPTPLLITVVTSELALRNATGMGEFLDALSGLEVDGFYLLVNRSGSGYQAAMDSRAMENLMYFVHVLAHLNDYQVVVGYSDWLGFLLHAAGASATATGWHQSLRQFSMARFEPAGGGRRARKRYSSTPLLSNPLITPELEDIYRAGLLNNVLSAGTHDAILRGGPAAGESRWTDEMGCFTHWGAVGSTIGTIEAQRRPAAKLNAAIQLIDGARTLYDRLVGRRVNFEPQTGPDHLTSWRDALLAFRHTAGV